jgi:hypothetical protein
MILVTIQNFLNGFGHHIFFGDKNYLLVEPNDSSKIKTFVPYFEKIFIPNFKRQHSEAWKLMYCYPCELYKSGFYLIPDTERFFAGGNQNKNAIFNKDHKKHFSFISSNYTISCDNKYLTYSIDEFSNPLFQSIYLFDFETWQNKKIAQGFSPITSVFEENIENKSKLVDFNKNPYSISKYRIFGKNAKILNSPIDSAIKNRN